MKNLAVTDVIVFGCAALIALFVLKRRDDERPVRSGLRQRPEPNCQTGHLPRSADDEDI